MARQRDEKKNMPVSPINGQEVPRGRPFTSETAREARQKRAEKERAKNSITAAFFEYMGKAVAVEKDGAPLTGAQAIAKSIIQGAAKNNAKMVEIALALTGELPATKIVQDVSIVDEATREQVEELLNEIGKGASSGD